MAHRHVELAALLAIDTIQKHGPLGVPSAVGSLGGFPIAVAWTTLNKASVVRILVRFRQGSLSTPAGALKTTIESNPKILEAMGKKSLSSREKKELAVLADGIIFTWYFSFRAPKPASVAEVARGLVENATGAAKPVDAVCEKCNQQNGELYSVDSALLCVCGGCRERMSEEDRSNIAAYEARESRPIFGVLAGIAVAAVMSLLWGLIAYSINRIFLFGAFAIGGAIAWAVNRASGKVTTFGRVVTMFLTFASVIAGDYLFLLLSAAHELHRPVDGSLLSDVAAAFPQFEFVESSGWISVLFAIIGAVYILYVNRPPVAKRTMVPIRPVLSPAYKPIE